jgi:hypothetical protein
VKREKRVNLRPIEKAIVTAQRQLQAKASAASDPVAKLELRLKVKKLRVLQREIGPLCRYNYTV